MFVESLQATHGKNGPWAPTVVEQEMILNLFNLPPTWGYYRPSQEGWERWKHTEFYELAKLCVQTSQTLDSDGDTDSLIEKLNPTGYANLPQIAEAEFGPSSPEHFAAQVIDLAGRLDFAREQGFPYVTEALAFGLGRLILARQTKIYAQQSWEAGEKVRAGGRKGAELSNGTPQQRQQRDDAIIEAMAAEHRHGRGKMASYKKIAKIFDVSTASVRRAMKKIAQSS
ncbi:hypothetical protein DC522_31540 [Microvirga sp. KLBC 81]|uniref:hypothetical protein n=1 Tax=Microvirga sp. KLBC 81 TaxID=1862707 RepID=UPI000D510181|nr:hypothetical protein [Microvirga sp. KLBC 81]PVE20573.1 hypothetical protein DC522_31540 [Microvirga sp. KLBC 81]